MYDIIWYPIIFPYRWLYFDDIPIYPHIVDGCWWFVSHDHLPSWHDYPWSDPPGPACLKLGKVIEAPVSRTRSDRTWKSLGKTWKTPKNPLNPPLFPLKIGKKRGVKSHFKTDPVGLTILLKPSTHYSQHNQHNGMIDMDCSLSKSMLTVSLKKTQVWMVLILLPSGKQAVCYRKLSFLIGKSMNSTAIFNSKLLQITRGVSSGKSSSMAPFLSL